MNLKKISLALFLFLSQQAFSHGLHISERFVPNNNSRFSFGLGSGVHIVDDEHQYLPKDSYGFGLRNLVGNVFMSTQFFPGFELTGAITVGAGSYGKLFSESASNLSLTGLYLNSEIGFRYLHKISEDVDVGGHFVVGYGSIFARGMEKLMNDVGLAWPLHFRIGPAMRWTKNENLTLYSSLFFTLQDLGSSKHAVYGSTIFGAPNKMGLALPVGMMWAFNDAVSMFSELELAVRDFSGKNLGFNAGLTVGVSFDFFK